MITLSLRKWLVDLIAHLTACPALVFIVLLKPLVSGDLDLVLIPALAHNMRVLSLDRYASVRATALSLAKIRLDIAHVQLRRDPAIEPLTSCLAVTHRVRVWYCVSDGPRSIMSVGSGACRSSVFFAEWRPYPPCWDSENACVFKLLYTYNGFVEVKSEQKPSLIAEAFFPHPSVRSILHGIGWPGEPILSWSRATSGRFTVSRGPKQIGAAPAQCSSRRQTPNSTKVDP